MGGARRNGYHFRSRGGIDNKITSGATHEDYNHGRRAERFVMFIYVILYGGRPDDHIYHKDCTAHLFGSKFLRCCRPSERMAESYQAIVQQDLNRAVPFGSIAF